MSIYWAIVFNRRFELKNQLLSLHINTLFILCLILKYFRTFLTKLSGYQSFSDNMKMLNREVYWTLHTSRSTCELYRCDSWD